MTRISTEMQLDEAALQEMKNDRFLRLGILNNHKNKIAKIGYNLIKLERDYSRTKKAELLLEITDKKEQLRVLQARYTKIIKHCGTVKYINDLDED